MDFEIASSQEDDLLVVTFTGRSTEMNVDAMIRRYFELLLASGTQKVLVDLRQLQGRLSPGHVYYLVRNLPVKSVPAGIRTAILELPERQGFAHFLETTAANASLDIKTFFDREQCLSWLRS